MATKKNTKKNNAKKNMTMKATGNTTTSMVAYCVGCRGKVQISGLKQVSFKGKGTATRMRLEGTCENGHKFFRFMKST